MQPVKPTILCTGPVDLSLLSEWDQKNANIEILNFTAITTRLPEDVQQAIKSSIEEKAFVVFTSSNAITSVVNFLDNKLPDWTIFCLGNTTYELAKKYFGAGSIRQTASNAAMLAERIIEENKIRKLIFFCGNLRRNDLPDTLRQKNIEVKEIIVYQTTPVPTDVNKEYDAVLFFSPSAVGSFFSGNTLPSRTILFAMGNATADKIRTCSRNKIITADEPDKIHLIKKAIKSLV